MSLFDTKESQQFYLLAKHWPDGKLWNSKFSLTSNIGQIVNALSKEFHRFQLLVKQIWDEFGINTTSELITSWEKSVGIPCLCFGQDETLIVRRKQVLNKFNNFGGVQIAEDFKRVAADFGLDINVYPGSEKLTGTDKEIKHTIVVELLQPPSGPNFFPLPFPVQFSSGGATNLQCIFDQLAPANVKVDIYEEGGI